MVYSKIQSFEYKLAFYTAPTLLGIKSACIFSIDMEEMNVERAVARFNQRAKQNNIHIKVMCRCEKRAVLFIYNEVLLNRQVEKNKEFLNAFGYEGCSDVNKYLEVLGERFECSLEFPHEIGVFLGYPTDDILGFIENNGEDFKMCGYWKVYANEEQARRIFDNYDKCRVFLCDKLNRGVDFYKTLKIS